MSGKILEFPVLLEPDSASTEYEAAIFLRLPGNWSGRKAQPCITIVERPGLCSKSAFDGNCSSRALWQTSVLSSFLGFEVPRPGFARGAHLREKAHNHSVCFHAKGVANEQSSGEHSLALPLHTAVVLGPIVYFPMPKVRFIDTVIGIGVRTFLNPGWHRKIRVECRNCSRASRMTLAPIIPQSDCIGVARKGLASAATVLRDSKAPSSKSEAEAVLMQLQESLRRRGKSRAVCNTPARSPCTGYIDQAFSSSSPESDPYSGDEALFAFHGAHRLLPKEKRQMFHHNSAICFYANEAMPHGWLIGFAALHMDSGDMQAFVVFVCFFGVVLPLICMVTALLHINKQERCKQHLQHMRAQVQREQLASELSDRGIGGRGGSSEYPNSTAGHRHGGASASFAAAMSELIGEPRPTQHHLLAMLDPMSAIARMDHHQWTLVNARELRSQLAEVQDAARHTRERPGSAGGEPFETRDEEVGVF